MPSTTPSCLPKRESPHLAAGAMRWLAWVVIVAGYGHAAEPVAPAVAGVLPTLTTVRQVQQLSPEEAARQYPVRLQGVITHFARDVPIRFLQDETGGTYFTELQTDDTADAVLEPGTIVEVEGVTVPGRFAPYVGRGDGQAVRWRVLGQGPLPAPRRLSLGELADPQHHSHYLETTGVVRQVTQRAMDHLGTKVVWLKIGSPTSTVTAQYYDPAGQSRLPDRILGARVLVRGVRGSTFNERRQLVGLRLFIDPARGIEVEQPGPRDPFTELPLTPVAALMQFSGEFPGTPMARTEGLLVQAVPGRGFYLESDARGVWVESDSALGDLRAGDKLTVVGFPAFGDWNPVIKDARFQVAGHTPPAAPPLLSPREARSGAHDCRRVTLEATLLQLSELGDAPTGVLQRDGITFVVEWVPGSSPFVVRRPDPGSLVRVTGVCLNRRIEPLWPAFKLRPLDALVAPPDSVFRLLLAGADDLVVVRAPAWWTPARTWMLAGAVAMVAAAVIGWNASLRRRVETQTEIIRTQATREAVQEDRTRIARELHDTLEQELTGIAVQLDAASDRLPESAPAAAAAALDSARTLLRHTRREARRSVWDLRATLLEEGDLASALQAVAQQLGASPAIRVTTVGERRRLAAVVENNLLRIGTEAMTNAVKHAGATTIDVQLSFDSGEVRLDVVDDGRGFDASRSTTLAAGHFGLLGMRERAERLGARFSLDSRPGAGTRVAVGVPLAACGETTNSRGASGPPSRPTPSSSPV